MKKESVTVSAGKVLRTSLSFTGSVEGVSSQIVVANPVASLAIAQFTQKGLSQRRSVLIGENVRDAIRSIKGK